MTLCFKTGLETTWRRWGSRRAASRRGETRETCRPVGRGSGAEQGPRGVQTPPRALDGHQSKNGNSFFNCSGLGRVPYSQTSKASA